MVSSVSGIEFQYNSAQINELIRENQKLKEENATLKKKSSKVEETSKQIIKSYANQNFIYQKLAKKLQNKVTKLSDQAATSNKLIAKLESRIVELEFELVKNEDQEASFENPPDSPAESFGSCPNENDLLLPTTPLPLSHFRRSSLPNSTSASGTELSELTRSVSLPL